MTAIQFNKLFGELEYITVQQSRRVKQVLAEDNPIQSIISELE